MVERVGGQSNKPSGWVESNTPSLLVPGKELVVPEKIVTAREVMDRFDFDFRPIVYQKLAEQDIKVGKDELIFFEGAKRHAGSDAYYFVEQKVGKHRIYTSAVFEDGQTSRHKHSKKHKRPVVEFYFEIGGKSYIFTDDDDKRQEPNEEGIIIVYPEHFHQIRQPREHASLNLMVLTNSADIPDNQVHITS